MTLSDLLQMFLAHKRSIVVRGVRGHAGFPLASRLYKLCQEFWVNASFHKDPAGAKTNLTLRRDKRVEMFVI